MSQLAQLANKTKVTQMAFCSFMVFRVRLFLWFPGSGFVSS